MIKYYFYNNHIVPLYVFKNSTLTGEKLASYLEASPVKMPITSELGEYFFSKSIVSLSEVDPADLLFVIGKN